MKILVATDGSAPAAVGIRLAAGIAWPADTIIRVVTAVDSGSALFGGPWPTVALLQLPEVEAELKAAAARVLAEASAPLVAAGLTVETDVLEGRASVAIAAEAERFGADLLVVGSRGHGAIDTMLLGSVTAELLGAARLPILVARSERLARVVLAHDGSAGAERAATILETWPILRSAQVRVVMVSETPVPWWATAADPAGAELIPAILEAIDQARADRGRLNAAMAARLAAHGITADAEHREGDAAAELLVAASEWGADTILMGTRGRSGLALLALGSVARNVVSHASCSVLIVRGPDDSGRDDAPSPARDSA